MLIWNLYSQFRDMLTISTNVFELDSRWSEACFALPRWFHLLYRRHYEHCTFTGCSYPIGSMYGIICTYTLVDFYGKYIYIYYIYLYVYIYQTWILWVWLLLFPLFIFRQWFVSHAFCRNVWGETSSKNPHEVQYKYVQYIYIHMNYMHILIYTHLPRTRFCVRCRCKILQNKVDGCKVCQNETEASFCWWYYYLSSRICLERSYTLHSLKLT